MYFCSILILIGITFLLHQLDYISGTAWLLVWLTVLMVERCRVLIKEKQGLIPLVKTIWGERELLEEELEEYE